MIVNRAGVSQAFGPDGDAGLTPTPGRVTKFVVGRSIMVAPHCHAAIRVVVTVAGSRAAVAARTCDAVYQPSDLREHLVQHRANTGALGQTRRSGGYTNHRPLERGHATNRALFCEYPRVDRRLRHKNTLPTTAALTSASPSRGRGTSGRCRYDQQVVSGAVVTTLASTGSAIAH
jgi:hypothetical protein